MRTRLALLAAACLWTFACGGEPLPPENPRSAAAKGKKPARKKGEKHGSEAIREKPEPGVEAVSGEGKAWGGWRYQGDDGDCFFVVGRRCYADEKAACKAAKCGKKRCEIDGAGPARVACG